MIPHPSAIDPPTLAEVFRPNDAGYLGYIDPMDHRASRAHVNCEAIAWQPIALLYNQPAHCDSGCMYRRFLATERDYTDRFGEYEWQRDTRPLRDGHWSENTIRFRTLRAPHHYHIAPTQKLFDAGTSYSLANVLDDCGYRRSLDGAEETQQIVVFSAMDPATPIGFFSFHRRVERPGRRLRLFLYPNFIYVSPPYRGLGYGITLVAAALEIWENELHHQSARYRGTCARDVQIDADAIARGMGRPMLDLLRHSTVAAMESCASYWGCDITPLKVVRGGLG